MVTRATKYKPRPFPEFPDYGLVTRDELVARRKQKSSSTSSKLLVRRSVSSLTSFNDRIDANALITRPNTAEWETGMITYVSRELIACSLC